MSAQAELDSKWMQRALELAAHGIGLASPNPAVGCVLVDRAGNAIGEGWHEYDKRDHAEVVALRAAGTHAQGATAYVTLEPCNHTGRTGPCTQALIAAGSLYILSGVRAYVGGESLWSKGQKDAIHYLQRYGQTRDPEDYRRYQAQAQLVAQTAKARGARVVLFTDIYASPLRELADLIVSAPVVSPSPFDSLVPAMAQVEALIPLGRLALPTDIGDVAVWLASDLASYVTGADVAAHGGGDRPQVVDEGAN